MDKLDKIEKDVAALKVQMGAVSGKIHDLENTTQSHSTDIDSIKSTISETKSTLEGKCESLERLWSFAQETATKADQRIKEIKEAIQENIDKIGQFDAFKKNFQKEISMRIKQGTDTILNDIRKELTDQIMKSAQATKSDIQGMINRNAHDIAYKALQDQAYFNRHNLVLLGIKEHEQDSAFTQASNFFNKYLKLSNLSMDIAYRVGTPPAPDSSYTRPIIVKFSRLSDRNSIWKKRNDFSREGQVKFVRIQADLPKQLREDLQILYRVQRAALKSDKYQTAEVKNYKLYLDGEDFSAWELESLPFSFRPSTLATRNDDHTLVFYSKHSPLSNHHPSPFEVRGRSYATMEQFLAYKKAKLSGNKILINRALLAVDPVEAKVILNTLRSDHQEEWKKGISDLAMEGLQAKFRQNKPLADFLCSTGNRTLGEASKNQQWGVGFTLDDNEVLDKSKWNKQGNLLGRLLMKIRNQMLQEKKDRQTAKPIASAGAPRPK